MPRTNRTHSLVPDEVPVAGACDLRTGATITSQRRYQLRERIAEGGMGLIFRAHDTSLGRDVALKFLKPDVPQQSRERFAREAQLGAGLSHPGLVPVFDRGVLPDGGEWLAMELLSGHDLHDVLEAQGRLPVSQLVTLFSQVLDALHYIHQRQLVHRDIKPENLFVVRDPQLDRAMVGKVLDFGIALDLRSPPRAHGMLEGDPRYMAPEQTELHRDVDAGADIYALGLCLFEAATGWHPMREQMSGPVLALLMAHREGGFAPPSRFLPEELPARFGVALDAIVERACAVDRRDRYADAQEMREEVEALAELAAPTEAEPAANGPPPMSLCVAS